MNTNKRITQFILPEIYVKSLNKSLKSKDFISIESIVKIANELGLDTNEVLTSYCVTLITLVYGCQAKLCAKLIVPKQADSSQEKAFQKTETHHIVTKILSNSKSSKLIIALFAILKAILRGYYPINEQEGESKEAYTQAILFDLEQLTTGKGGANSKFVVRDPETRLIWLRSMSASIRSKWCAFPTFTPTKIVSAGGISIKSVKMNHINSHLNNVWKGMLEEGIIGEINIPSIEDITAAIKEEVSNLKIDNNIDDSIHGKFNEILLEKEVFDFTRIDLETTHAVKVVEQPFVNDFKNKLF